MVRYRIALVGMLAVLAIPLAALAGGWAIASFDDVPGGFQAGATYDLEYTILQHGETPVDVGQSQVRILDANGTVTAFDAAPAGETGRYSVSITFPESGTWQWEVTLGDFASHPMGTVEVTPAANAAAGSGSMVAVVAAAGAGAGSRPGRNPGGGARKDPTVQFPASCGVN